MSSMTLDAKSDQETISETLISYHDQSQIEAVYNTAKSDHMAALQQHYGMSHEDAEDCIQSAYSDLLTRPIPPYVTNDEQLERYTWAAIQRVFWVEYRRAYAAKSPLARIDYSLAPLLAAMIAESMEASA